MIPANRQIHAKLEIVRPSGRVDVTPYLESAEVELGNIQDLGTGTGADVGVRTLSFRLRNNGQKVHYWELDSVLGDSDTVIGNIDDDVDIIAILGNPKSARHSFAPMDKGSKWNLVDGQWVPLLWPNREVVFRVAITTPGVKPSDNDWITLFEGYLGDSIVTEAHTITVTCRDKSKRLQDAYCDVAKSYAGPLSAETLIQAIINDYVDDPPALYCPIPSGVTFDKMVVEYCSVWDAIQNVAKQIGWFLGYRWNGSEYALTFMEPPRDKTTADFELNWEDDIYHESLEISDADIRNVVTVTYRDKATGERKTVTVINDESIAEYGRRAMQIEEADTSLIDTEEKALNFANKCLWDLSELSATDKLDVPLLPELDLFSTLLITNPLTSSTTDFYAVQTVRHTLDFGERASFRTEIIATGRVVGARKRWTAMETRPGRPGQPIDPDRIPPGELPPDRLPDYSLGVEKFMENLKPPIVVTSLPSLPDPRYTIGTSVFLTTDKKLYSTDGNTWKPVGAGTVTADEIVAGIITAGGIKADWYADIRNVLPYTGQDSLDKDNPIVIPFYVPSETTKIVAAFLSARAMRYRAYAKSAPYNEYRWWIKRTGAVATSLGEKEVSVELSYSDNEDTGNTSLDHHHKHYDYYISSSGGAHIHQESDFQYNHPFSQKIYTEQGGSDNHIHAVPKVQTRSSGSHTHQTTFTQRDTTGPYQFSSTTDLTHSHKYRKVNNVELKNFNDHKHDFDPSHSHDLEFGIYEGTTPNNVKIRINNGSGWSSYINLATTTSETTPYDLIAGASVPKHNNNQSEMDLTPYLSGTGWKYIEFTSSRLGRIHWNLILKVDITA